MILPWYQVNFMHDLVTPADEGINIGGTIICRAINLNFCETANYLAIRVEACLREELLDGLNDQLINRLSAKASDLIE